MALFKGGHAMPNLVKSIHLTDDDQATLEGILRQNTVEARTYIRAKILLLKAECRSNESIADKLDICVSAVRLCIDKYNAGGIEAALRDTKGNSVYAFKDGCIFYMAWNNALHAPVRR